jgi:hypothetical protein
MKEMANSRIIVRAHAEVADESTAAVALQTLLSAARPYG